MTPDIEIVYHPAGSSAVHIGMVTEAGKVLDKDAFHQLRGVNRLRAYLLMVWPAARKLRTMARVCDVRYQSISTLLRDDVQQGLIQRRDLGQYAATPAKPPAHVRRPHDNQEGRPS